VIWDCFSINDELELLEARCRELDRSGMEHTHVLIESFITHRGRKKPLHYDEHRAYFKQWPIVGWAVQLPLGEGDKANWLRERSQREHIRSALECFAESGSVGPHDLILVNDVDEIVSADALDRIVSMASEGPVRLSMPLFYYSLDWQVQREGKPVLWNHGRAFLWKDRPRFSLSELRNDHGTPRPEVPDAGWHFSWFGSPEDRAKKLHDFAHSELDTKSNATRFQAWSDLGAENVVMDALGSPLVRSELSLPDSITEVLGRPYERRDARRYERAAPGPGLGQSSSPSP
jgi:hypothetical protein